MNIVINAIGVANFQPDRIMDLMLHNTVTPAINQVEANPFNQRIDTQRFLWANSVQTEAWAPFAEGRNHIFENPTLQAIATRHKKSVAPAILGWVSQRGIVLLSKSVHEERIGRTSTCFNARCEWSRRPGRRR